VGIITRPCRYWPVINQAERDKIRTERPDQCFGINYKGQGAVFAIISNKWSAAVVRTGESAGSAGRGRAVARAAVMVDLIGLIVPVEPVELVAARFELVELVKPLEPLEPLIDLGRGGGGGAAYEGREILARAAPKQSYVS
jgi:hypothetical protein